MSFVNGIDNFFLDVFEFFHSFDSLLEVRADKKSLSNFELIYFSDFKFVNISSSAFEGCHQVDK